MTFSNNFTPYSTIIQSISNTLPAIVVTVTPHGYDNGLLVRTVVPQNCGMQQIDGLVSEITVIDPTSFSIPVNASNFDSFAYTSVQQLAQVIPVGVQSVSLTQAESNAGNIIPEF